MCSSVLTDDLEQLAKRIVSALNVEAVRYTVPDKTPQIKLEEVNFIRKRSINHGLVA